MKREIERILKTLTLLCAIPLLSSCVYDNFPEGSPGATSDGVEINLSIVAGGLASRSGDHTTYSTGEAYESAINVTGGDFAIFVFDGQGNYLDRFEPGQIYLKSNGTTTVNGVELYTYNVSGVFRPQDGVESVQLMVLANWMTLGGNYNQVQADLESRAAAPDGTSDIDWLFSEDAEYHYSYADALKGGTTSWTPQSNPGIPMTALSATYSIPAPNNTITATEPINALRGMAKIEIVDKAPGEGAKISGCTLTGYNTAGRYIPLVDASTNQGWNVQATQVSVPSLPKDGQIYTASKLGFVAGERSVTPEGESVAQTRKVYSAYIPEMDLAALVGGGTERPKLEITLDGNTKVYDVELARYDGDSGKPATKDDGSTDYFDYLLRNHLYRFNITAIESGIDGELELIIDNEATWDIAQDTYYYDDIEVAFDGASSGGSDADGKFKWLWETDNVDPQDAKLSELGISYEDLVLNWNTYKDSWDSHYLVVNASGESAAVATFTLTKPERGKWTLALYSDDDTPNHWFMIEIWNEASQTWEAYDQRMDTSEGSAEHNPIYDSLTGDIAAKWETPQEVKVRISAQQLQYTPLVYKARLVMNVTTFDGRMVEVDLVNGTMFTSATPDSAKEYFYVMQYPTPLQ